MPETEINPLEELGNSIEAFKLKLKVAFDDLTMLEAKAISATYRLSR